VDEVGLYFDVEGCALAAQSGTMVRRPTLVLLHGGPGADHSFFKPEFSAMADAAQVIYLDQRGSGRSDRGDPSDWTWSRWADDVATFCRTLEIESPLLVGTSSGGRVAVECATRHPGLASGLILDSTLFESSIDESLDVFGRRGGPAARQAAARLLGGDRSPEALAAWKTHAMPLYGSASDGDTAARAARARVNREVQARFGRGECGPLKVTAEGAVMEVDRADLPQRLAVGAPTGMPGQILGSLGLMIVSFVAAYGVSVRTLTGDARWSAGRHTALHLLLHCPPRTCCSGTSRPVSLGGVVPPPGAGGCRWPLLRHRWCAHCDVLVRADPSVSSGR
jgi:proline iminopeptidase